MTDTENSGLALLREALDETLTTSKRIALTGARTGWELQITVGELEQIGTRLRKYTQIARGGKNRPDTDYDGYVYNSLLVSEFTTALYKGGTLVADEDGEPITFRSKAMLQLTGRTTGAEAARRFLASDPLMLKVGQQILQLAGYTDDELAVSDPGPGRSDG